MTELETFAADLCSRERQPPFGGGPNADPIFRLMRRHGLIPVYRDFVNSGQCNVIFVTAELKEAFAEAAEEWSDSLKGLSEVLRA